MYYLKWYLKKFFKKNEFKEKIKKIKKDLKLKKKGINYIFNFKNKEITLRKSFGEDRYFEMIFNIDKNFNKKRFCFLKNKYEIVCEIPELKDTIEYFIKRKYFDKKSFILIDKNIVFCYLPIKVLDDINAIKMIINSLI